MEHYEELLIQAEEENLIVKEFNLKGNAGRIRGNRIAIHQCLTSVEKACVLAEEIGHYITSVGDILDQSDLGNRKQERAARIWAYNRIVGLCGLIQAYNDGYRTSYEVADYLGVTEEFLQDTIDYYTNKYGVSIDVCNYRIQFIPFLDISQLDSESECVQDEERGE